MLSIALLACLALVAWNVAAWPAVRRKGEGCSAMVSVLIPARDEENNIGECLDCVCAQACVDEILVYDDHSSDQTRDIVLARSAKDARIRLADVDPLPSGWCGKTFACARLAGQARCEWLLFIDADARLSPDAVGSMVAECRSRSATFLSCWPGLVMRGFWEKLLMPMLNFVVFSSYPAPLALIRRDPALGLAHGACILVARREYEDVGGHAAVAAEIFEDTRLARVWREHGHVSLCLDGQHVVSVRMYSGWREIWLGFQKNFRGAFQTSWSFWIFMIVHAVLFLSPFLLAKPAALAVIAARLLLCLRFRHAVWSALLHPFAEMFVLALGLASCWAWQSGRGVEWKGRRYQHT